MNEDFRLNDPHLLGESLEKLRRSLAYQGHPLSKGGLTKSVGMSMKTYNKLASGVAGMQDITCEC